MKKISTLTFISIALFVTGCTVKPYVTTNPTMAYNLTGINITELNTSKVCTSSENNDVSVRHAAQIANFSKVYAVDNQIEWSTHLFGPPTISSQCTIVYGK